MNRGCGIRQQNTWCLLRKKNQVLTVICGKSDHPQWPVKMNKGFLRGAKLKIYTKLLL